MTLEDLQALGLYWQQRLNLPEWTITFGAIDVLGDNLGECGWHPEEHKAIVNIYLNQEEVEETLVHELLHIVLEGHKHYKRYNVATEVAINRIAAALTAG